MQIDCESKQVRSVSHDRRFPIARPYNTCIIISSETPSKVIRLVDEITLYDVWVRRMYEYSACGKSLDKIRLFRVLSNNIHYIITIIILALHYTRLTPTILIKSKLVWMVSFHNYVMRLYCVTRIRTRVIDSWFKMNSCSLDAYSSVSH